MNQKPRFLGCTPSHTHELARAIPLGAFLEQLPDPIFPFDSLAGHESALQPFGNDAYGDCTMAEAANRLAGVSAGATGTPTPLSAQTIITQYFDLTDGADSGLDIATELQWESTTGLTDDAGNQHACGIYGTIDPENWNECLSAIAHCRWLKLGITASKEFMQATPNSAVDPPRFIGGPLNHCVGAYACRLNAHDNPEIGVATWGYTLWLGETSWTTLVREAWAIPQDPAFINPATGKTFDGLDLGALLTLWNYYKSQTTARAHLLP
jgi:hypothetical protein